MVPTRLTARLNAVVAVGLVVEMQAEAALATLESTTRLALHVCLLALAAAFAVRRRLPLVSLGIAQAVFVSVTTLGQTTVEQLYVPLFVVLFLGVSAAMNTDGRRFWAVPAMTFAGGLLSIANDDYAGGLVGDLLWTGVIYTGLTAAIGRLLRSRLELQSALRAKAERLERERREARERAVTEERERIAGDLRDIIAHALSGMVVQASAARRLAATDPERAREAFAAVETSGRDALDELRRLLGVLRREDEELALAPQPSLDRVEALVARIRAAGLPVDLRVEGTAVPLPAGVDLTAYRVLQDALGHALESSHAGSAEVTVRYGDQAVELEVRDDGRARAGGEDRRLLGMRERVGLVGGQLETGVRRDGGHRVRARLPVEAP